MKMRIEDFLEGNKERKVKFVSGDIIQSFGAIKLRLTLLEKNHSDFKEKHNITVNQLLFAEAEANLYKNILERYLPPVKQTEMYCNECSHSTTFLLK